MIPLDRSKPVKRKAVLPLDNRKFGDEVVVSLYPNKTIGFRRLRCRKEVVLPLSAVYSMAIKAEIRVAQRERKLARRKQ